MSTPDESKILKIIEVEGGECTIGKIAREMRLEPNYVRVILRSMGESDIIDVFRNGKVRIASKGCVVMGKQPPRQNGMKRYLEDREKWTSF
ncbi:hypothetical protein KKH65_02670 [bacterium]|nr:hypothetical protein [Planctomycetota bacterium]MBU1517974.1 hypothetical protein [Planctomycetota bacterium]MBU2461761.1 hypothetical protein [bacterium]